MSSTSLLTISAEPLNGNPVDDLISLGRKLEIELLNSPVLRGDFQRIEIESNSTPLGFSWSGAIKIAVATRDALISLRNAIWSALKGSKVVLQIEKNGTKFSIEMENAKFDEVSRFIEGIHSDVFTNNG